VLVRIRSVLAVAAAALLTGLIVAPAHAEASAPDYVRTTYDGTIFEVTDDDVVPLTFEEWSSLGFPAFSTASTSFEKVLTFPTVTAVTVFDRPGMYIEVDVTWDEFRAAGFPRVAVQAWGPDISVHKWGTSPELLAEDRAGDILKLTYDQWRGAGFPSFTAREGRGFVHLSWDASGGIAYMCDTGAGKGGRLTYEQWVSLGSPTPLNVTHTANDLVWRIFGGADLSYIGAINLVYNPSTLQPGLWNRDLSYADWLGMGSPAPVDRIPDASADLACQPGSLLPWE
jgi:hypothetical protein